MKQVFRYDYLGRRIRRQAFFYVSGDWMTTPYEDALYVYDGWNVLLELDALDDNAVIRSYTWGLDLSGTPQGAGGIGGLLAVHDTNGTPSDGQDDLSYLYLYDANGNVSQLIDPIYGQVAAAYEYDPYGQISHLFGDYCETNRYRFSTKHLDEETELYYYGYRYYSPRLGRWVSRDPLGNAGSTNLSVSNANALTNRIDPNGDTSVTSQPGATSAPAICNNQSFTPQTFDVILNEIGSAPGYTDVLIRYTPKTKCECDEIRFVQIVETLEIQRLAGWTTRNPWHIDALPPSEDPNSPFYPYQFPGGCISKHKAGPAELDDQPGKNVDSIWGNWKSFFALYQEFETCAICIKKDSNGGYSDCKNLGCVRWGHSGHDGVIERRNGGGNAQKPNPPSKRFSDLTNGKLCGGKL